jgi:hypothetical protein
VLEEYTTEEQRSLLRFCGQKDQMQSIFINKCSLFTVGSVRRIKRFTTGSRNLAEISLKTESFKRRCGSGNSQYAASFDALVKRWDKCINAGGGYVE